MRADARSRADYFSLFCSFSLTGPSCDAGPATDSALAVHWKEVAIIERALTQAIVHDGVVAAVHGAGGEDAQHRAAAALLASLRRPGGLEQLLCISPSPSTTVGAQSPPSTTTSTTSSTTTGEGAATLAEQRQQRRRRGKTRDEGTEDPDLAELLDWFG